MNFEAFTDEIAKICGPLDYSSRLTQFKGDEPRYAAWVKVPTRNGWTEGHTNPETALNELAGIIYRSELDNAERAD